MAVAMIILIAEIPRITRISVVYELERSFTSKDGVDVILQRIPLSEMPPRSCCTYLYILSRHLAVRQGSFRKYS